MLHLKNFVMDLALTSYLLNLLNSSILVAVLQIEQNSIIEKDSILGYYADILSVGLKLKIF